MSGVLFTKSYTTGDNYLSALFGYWNDTALFTENYPSSLTLWGPSIQFISRFSTNSNNLGNTVLRNNIFRDKVRAQRPVFTTTAPETICAEKLYFGYEKVI